MKVLWICNKLPQPLARLISLDNGSFGGWLDYLCQRIMDTSDIAFSVAYPGISENCINANGTTCYCYKENNRYAFDSIIKQEAPDVIHIWGTEFIHSYNAVQSAIQNSKIKKCVVSIQGLVSIYGKYHYTEGIPNNIVKRFMPRDILKPSSINQGRKDYLNKGKYEIKTLQLTENVIGRTDWDKAITYLINPQVNYFFCNECLRDSFYNNMWEINKIERHSIFVSQCDYPIKGFHYMLDALKHIVKFYPDTMLYTTGKDLLHMSSYDIAKMTSYQKYIRYLIRRYELENHISFLGMLSEEDMCLRFCKSHVFVSPSTIENSPNSVGEAMILGCPVVSTDVGGVKNMMLHGKEGFIYQSSAPYMCAYYVMKLFDDDKLSLDFSSAGREHAQKIFNREKNYQTLIDIYKTVMA